MKAAKVKITPEMYEAIEAGLSELECALYSGYIDDPETIERYRNYIKALEELIRSIKS